MLSVASMPMPILQRNKAGHYSPIRGAFSGHRKFILFTENTQDLPDAKNIQKRKGYDNTAQRSLHLYSICFI